MSDLVERLRNCLCHVDCGCELDVSDRCLQLEAAEEIVRITHACKVWQSSYYDMVKERDALRETAARCSAESGTAWRYEIQHGPNGESNYAWVFDGNNFMVCTAQIHHAVSIVKAMNAAAPQPAPAQASAESELEAVRKDAAQAWDKCEERRLAQERLQGELDRARSLLTLVLHTEGAPAPAQGSQQPVSYRWRQPGNKHWIYDPTPEWIEDHRHEIELEALYVGAAPQTPSQKDELLAFFLAFFEGWDRPIYLTDMEALERARAKVAAKSQAQVAHDEPQTARDLLKRARQFIADSGCDEDDHEVNIGRNELLAEIDAALSRPERNVPQAAPSREDIARAIFKHFVGLDHWNDPLWIHRQDMAYTAADAVLALSRPLRQEGE